MKQFIITSLCLIFLFACGGKGSEKTNNNYDPSTEETDTDTEDDDTNMHPTMRQYDTFPIFFCVVTNNDSVKKFVSYALLKNEVDTLNKYFSAEAPTNRDGRRKLVHFTFEGVTFYDEAKESASALVRLLDQERSYAGSLINELFDKETNQRIRHPNAINVYIYDSWHRTNGREDNTGHGRRNGNEPYMLLDYTRLRHKMAAEEHETGHCFGLQHRCDTNLTSNTQPSNIMNSGRSCAGRGGNRAIGFDDDQIAIIDQYRPLILEQLGLD